MQRGLPRQGIGSDEETLRALALCMGLPAPPVILDVGCGPGVQTMTLARATGGRVTAVDLHESSSTNCAGMPAQPESATASP